ncbi:phosphoglycerate mutase-like protein [Annulohypoxylon maeteangense]|uniref:phosphoglycerate mutase-like protein n=1 Tax=Annulohypoxylon maeteangense TaxID=1927788 RepID=UPI0020085D5A|nr:phosphoglycerate mutase-like protein [Annulohypoxylon maeteangense]KAI0890626.1 phosphoglycerate mutase-like protein [Annulohypoxylon maeteangense]
MPPTIILIRHGEALHNITNNWSLPDPGLSDRGIHLTKTLQGEFEPGFPFKPDECLIVVSPLKRTLETVKYGFQWLRNRGVRVEVRAEWQETTDNPCDIGADPKIIQSEWPDIDFSRLDPVYPQKIGLYENSEEAFQRRGAVAKEWLYNRPEKCIIVVTHSGFIRRLVKGPRYKNLEYGSYRLVQNSEGLEFEETHRVIVDDL